MSLKSKARHPISVLITWDVDPSEWVTVANRRSRLDTAMNICRNQGIRTTFFFTAYLAETYSDMFENMRTQGHEIGCHGLTHGDEENYDRMPEEMQRAYIKEATEKLQTLVGVPIRAFRSPRVKTSAHTLRLLAEYGYLADSSVCSQRIDLVSSNLVNTRWIFAPRRPYHPHRDSAFKRGDVSLWEIPVSAIGPPFISTTMRILGLPAMKTMFKMLYAESRRTGKPIVYLAHPLDFVVKTESMQWQRRWHRNVKRKYFTLSYIRAHGLRLRNLLYRTDGVTMLSYTQELFAYMASFPDVAFMTLSEYTNHLGEV